LGLDNNALTGPIPTQLGLLTSSAELRLSENSLFGPIPSELGMLTNTVLLDLDLNALSGAIPEHINALASNGSLETLALANNSLSGTVPETLCSLGLFGPGWGVGLSFDCSDQLCGCCWCPCPGSNDTSECQTHPFDPSEDDEEWPGMFPTLNNAITINIRTDDYPEETTLEWSLHSGPDYWQLLDTDSPEVANGINSYTKWVDPDALYRLQLFDDYEDGSCCQFGLGWFTITDSTPSLDYAEGTVVWEATGNILESSLDVFLWIDPDYHAQMVEYLPGQGYALIQDESLAGGERIIVVSEGGANRTVGDGEA